MSEQHPSPSESDEISADFDSVELFALLVPIGLALFAIGAAMLGN